MNELQQLKQQVADLQAKVDQLSRAQKSILPSQTFTDVVVTNSIRFGSKATAMHADREGFWWGQERLADIVGGAKGVAILMDGTFYQNP